MWITIWILYGKPPKNLKSAIFYFRDSEKSHQLETSVDFLVALWGRKRQGEVSSNEAKSFQALRVVVPSKRNYSCAKSLSVCLSVRDRIIMSYLFPWQRLDFFQVHFSSTRKLYKLNKKNSFSDDGWEIDHKVPSGMRLLLRYPISQRPGFQHSESWSFETECLRWSSDPGIQVRIIATRYN